MRYKFAITVFTILGFLVVILGYQKYQSQVDDLNWDNFSSLAVERVGNKQDELMDKYKLGSYEKWWYDQDKSIIQFINDDVVELEFSIAIAGDISKKSDTWMWSWENQTIVSKMSNPILAVKEFGNVNRMKRLTTGIFPAKTEDGWELSAVACDVIGGLGLYKAPDDNGELFIILLSVNKYLGQHGD